MDTEALKPILAGIVRHALTSAGGALVAGGYIQSSDTSALVGGGMVIAGMLWSWWQKEGQAKVSALLQKMTATKTSADAVKAAGVLPPAAAVDTAAKSVSVQSVVKVLLIAFLLSAFLVPAAFAQGLPKLKPLTGNIVNDLGLTKPPLITGNVEKDLQGLWDKIVASSIADLNYAAAMAKNANTQTSGIRLQCINAIIALNQQASGANLKNADGTPMTKPDPHVFTDVESLAEVIDNLSPQGPLFVNCAGAAQLAKTNVLTFVNAVVTGAAGFAAMPIIPGL
jgi:hypothetical protein